MMFHPQGPTFWELAQQALCSTERGYDLLAPKFDLTPFRTPAAMLAAVGGLLDQGESIELALDVCCGTGAGIEMLRPRCLQVVGADFSRNMIAVARQQIAMVSAGARVDFVRCDVLEMPLRNVFDLAVCFGALGHILPRDQPRFVQQVGQVLKPGGRFVFATAHAPPRLSRRHWLSRGFNAAMHLRNLFVSPPFIMYYLTFLLPQASRLLEAGGFTVDVRENVFPKPYAEACLVIATRQ